MILLIAETRDGQLNPTSLDALAAARVLDTDVTAVVVGAETTAAAEALGRAPLAGIIRLEHPGLAVYTADATVAALAHLVTTVSPSHVFCAHTYQARDYVPRLAARLDRPIVTDCSSLSVAHGTVTFARSIFQGKVTTDVTLEGAAPHVVTVQVGAFRADALPAADGPVSVRTVAAQLTDRDLRQSAERPFREVRQEVNLADASRIVAAGRGIKEEAQLDVVRRLASVLGAEVAASRPLCDAGWLPMDRQIGSSGQTVAPQLYLALGISGAIQHIVGMKGSKTIVAINKDADAPIFEIADYGIVGDLFEIVPALVAALEAR